MLEAIDIHIHGFSGLHTKDADPYEILNMAQRLLQDGITGFLPTVYSRPLEDMRRDMDAIKRAMLIQKDKGIVNQAEILGIHLEGPFLNPVRCGSLDAKAFLEPKERHLRDLIYGFEDVIKIITIAPELDGAMKLIKKAVDLGITVSMGHSDAKFDEAEAGFNAGARGITHIFNAMRPIHHREPGIAGFGLLNSHVYIEVIADLNHLDIRMMEMIFKIKNPDYIIIVSDAVHETGLKSTVVNGAGKLLGGSKTISQSAKTLINAGLDSALILKCISDNPKNYLLS
ncbi:MAG TPA: amidohydrolase family protein [Syntrophorhabdaceae bacterium]|nr:amidohydrolase family protein [Syntrophorhabdaceae bacterium]